MRDRSRRSASVLPGRPRAGYAPGIESRRTYGIDPARRPGPTVRDEAVYRIRRPIPPTGANRRTRRHPAGRRGPEPRAILIMGEAEAMDRPAEPAPARGDPLIEAMHRLVRLVSRVN